ncbi:MAG TPA: 50S ribosomal protein L13 [Candidatus Saccharimonadales bacterium]|nr:50S ribosomal protein L13 [Candidatus Saccharimonadales bacterium]
MKNMKTFSQKPADVTREWVVIDASESTLGRISTLAATRLLGKHKVTYTPHVDGGDYVIIINAGKVGITGNKLEDKKYYHHTGFPGGIKEKNLSKVMADDPAVAITAAIRGMMPSNKLRPGRLMRLKIYAGAEHNHEAQKPTKIGVK